MHARWNNIRGTDITPFGEESSLQLQGDDRGKRSSIRTPRVAQEAIA